MMAHYASHAVADPTLTRPSMRRKSSAQNILSSFKSTPPPISTAVPAPPPAAFASVPTPTATTPLGREWDAQSLHSDSMPGAGTQGTSVEYLRDLVQKRIITLTYVRNIHEGSRSHWFHTIMLSRADLDRVFNNAAMKKRTYRFAILGLSLSNLLDINHPHDLLKGLINTISDYDQSREESDKPKISQRLFKSSRLGKRPVGGGFAEYAVADGVEATSNLVTPNMPFPLDYHETLLSLLDVLSEVYNKISKILGPSPFPHSAQHMMGTLGLLLPHPGVSYLFSSADGTPQPQTESEGSLWGIATASMTGGSGMGSPPASWTPALGEMVLKVDGKFKKITGTLLKELDELARENIKDELASLDPLLRNIAEEEEPHEFDGM